MSHFEYKVIPAPTTGRWRQRRVDGMDKYASTIADVLTELGLEGWDFIGAEVLRERRRRLLILVTEVDRTFLVFRRRAAAFEGLTTSGKSADAAALTAERGPVAPVTPRRVKRPDLVEAVAAGARRVPVRAEPVDAEPAASGDALARAVDVARKERGRDPDRTPVDAARDGSVAAAE
jgi:hypothetical protein